MYNHILHLEGHHLGSSGDHWLSFGRDPFSSLIGLSFLSIIFLDSRDEGASAVGFSEVFSSNVQSLFDHPVSDLLVYSDSETLWIDIEDSTSSTMIEEMGHTGVDGPVNHNIHVLSDPDLFQIVLHSNGSVSTERS